jgi:hypothetical protein
LRVGQHPRTRVGLQQPVEQGGEARQEDIGRGQRLEIPDGQRGLIDGHRAVDARRSRRRDLDAVFLEAAAIDFEHFHVDDDLGPGLVDGGNELAGRGHPLGCIFQRDGVRAGD